jgi:hypothetical protein
LPAAAGSSSRQQETDRWDPCMKAGWQD